MDEIALVKNLVIETEWTERIRLCRESRLTVFKWCKENDINYKHITHT